MAFDFSAIAKDILSWGGAVAAVGGAVLHKIWSKVLGAEKALVAEVEKLKADAEAAAKKL
jgi:hypothetical protein